MKRKNKGILLVFIASILWSIQAILVEFAYKIKPDFINTSFISFIFIFLTSSVYIFLKKIKKKNKEEVNLKINKTQLKAIFYITITGVIVADVLFNFGFMITCPLNVVLIGHTQPIFIILISYFFLKEEKISKWDYIGGFFMLLSAFLVSSKTFENLINLKFGTIGELAVLIGTIAWASDSVVAKKYLTNINSGVIVFYRYLIALIIFSFYMIFFSYLRIDSVYQILVGIVVGIGAILFYEGLKILKATQVGFIELCSPFSTAVLSWIFLQENITKLQIIGLFLLVFGVYFISKSEEFH